MSGWKQLAQWLVTVVSPCLVEFMYFYYILHYVCGYVWMCVCMFVYVCVCFGGCVWVCVCVWMCVGVCRCVWICADVPYL